MDSRDIGSGILMKVKKTFSVTDKNRLFIHAFDNIENLHYEIAELYIYPPDMTHFRDVMMHEVSTIRHFCYVQYIFLGVEKQIYIWLYP